MNANVPSPASRREHLVVGLAGRIGAGKTTAARYLSTKHGLPYVRYSQVLRDWLGESRFSMDLQEAGWEVMSGGRQVALNAEVIAVIDRRNGAAVDGLRHIVDFQCMSYAFAESFHLVFLDASPGVRFGRKPRFESYEAFAATDGHSVEGNIDRLRSLAGAVILNEGTLESLHERLDHCVARWTSGGLA